VSIDRTRIKTRKDYSKPTGTICILCNELQRMAYLKIIKYEKIEKTDSYLGLYTD
jgi:hypothetical protein